MRISTCIFSAVLCSIQLLAAETGVGQTLSNRQLTLEIKNEPLRKALNKVGKVSGLRMAYPLEQVNRHKKINLPKATRTVEETLEEMLTGTRLAFKEGVNNTILIYEDRELNAQPPKTTDSDGELVDKRQQWEKVLQTIKGQVTDETGAPLPGASVLIKGTTQGVSTDVDGNYTITVFDETDVLIFSFVGYQSQEIVIGNRNVLSVALTLDTKSMDELVVVGYGTQKKVNLTGAVDKIDGKTLNSLQVNTMGEALMAQIPNLNVDIADGKAGRGASFNIRGMTSVNGGSPLIIIDGIPSSAVELNNLSPRDVEDISVLKDAASAAIYGARGAFGVILVRTKRAKNGETRISYNNKFTWGQASRVLEPYGNPANYLDIIQNEFNNNIGQYGVISQAAIDFAHRSASDPSLAGYQFVEEGGKMVLLAGGRVPNYYKEWFSTYAPKQNHHISLQSGQDKFSYFLAGDFNREKGLLKLKQDVVDRYSLRANLAYEFNKHARIFNNTYLLNRKDDMANLYVNSWRSNIWRWMEMFNHVLWPEEVELDGRTVPTESGFVKRFVRDYSGDNTNRNELSNTLGVELSYLENTLKFRGDFTYRFSNARNVRWADVAGVGPVWADANSLLTKYGANSYIEKALSNSRTMNVNAYGTYDKSVNNHYITLTAGINWEDYLFTKEFISRADPISIDQQSINLGTGAYTANDSDDRFANQSTFFRLSYDYDNRYLLEVNGNYNVSSKFPAGRRDALFASLSAGWRFSEEAFFRPLKATINNAKLRISYGSLGNQNIGSWDYLPMMSIPQATYSLEGVQPNYTSNPSPRSANFTWETAQTINVGLDLSLLRNRLSGTLDIYQRTTKDMLVKSHSLPSVFGAAIPKENNGTLRNRGWEATLGWNDKVKLNNKHLQYGMRATLSDYRAEIVDYYNPSGYLGDYYPGQQIGEIWGLNTLGFFSTDEEAQAGALLQTSGYRNWAGAGNLKFEDVNGDGVISKSSWTLNDHGDYQIIGNTSPRYQYGISLNAAWAGFDINAFFRGIGKRNIYPDAESMAFWGPYAKRYAVMPKHVAENRWTPENPDAYFPRPQGYIAGGENDLGVPQTRYLQNAAFFRLKNMVIGYTIPNRATSRLKLSNVRFFVSGQNLFEFTKLHDTFDPEGLARDPDGSASVGMGAAFPIQRSYAFGLEIQL